MNHSTSQFKFQIAYVLTSGSSLFAGRLTLADGSDMGQGVLPPKMTADPKIVRRTKSLRRSGALQVQVRLILTNNREKLDALFGDSSWPGGRKEERAG